MKLVWVREADKGSSEKALLHLLLFKCLQLKVIDIPKWHALGLQVLNSYSQILGWWVLLPFRIHSLLVDLDPKQVEM